MGRGVCSHNRLAPNDPVEHAGTSPGGQTRTRLRGRPAPRVTAVTGAQGPRVRRTCGVFAAARSGSHLSAGVPLDGLLHFAVGASPQRLQELVAVLQVVLVVVLLHARVPASVAARSRRLLGRDAGERGCSCPGRGELDPRLHGGGGLALLGPRTGCPPVGR